MGKLVLAAKITHVPSMYLSEQDGPHKGCRQAAIDGHKEIARRMRELKVDTIVVFDRIRENMLKGNLKDFEKTVDFSINETFVRSLNTSLTVIFVLFALFLIGGVTIHYFVLALLIGVITGTYSSICNASALLVVWENHEWRRFISWIPGVPKNKKPEAV